MQWTGVSVTMSLLVGMSLMRLLTGLVAMFQARRRASLDWLAPVWAIVMIVTVLESWTSLNALPGLIDQFSFPEYLALAAMLMLVFAAAQLLLPPGEIKAGDDMAVHFAEDGRFALLLFSAYLTAAAVANILLFGGGVNALWLYLDIPLIALPVAVFFLDRRWQRVLTLAYLPLFVVDIAISLQAGADA